MGDDEEGGDEDVDGAAKGLDGLKVEGSSGDGPAPETRKQREERQKEEARAAYRKKHEAGLTEEYKRDMAKLAEVKKRREAAEAKAKSEKEAAEQAEAYRK